MRPLKKTAMWGAIVLLVLLTAVFTALFFIDEPLRRAMQSNINAALKGYRVRLPALDFNPLGFTVTLEDLVLIQDAHPDPPVARIARLEAGVHWRALLRGRLVADFELRQPDLHINLVQLRKEASGPTPIEERGWQEAVRAIYPLKINALDIQNGRLTYIDEDPDRPLILSHILLTAENIRNVYSPDRVYPSPFHFTARVFDKGSASIQGRANLLAEPHPGLEARIDLRQVELSYFRPILARQHLYIDRGTFDAQGRMEYAPRIKTAHLQRVRVSGVAVDYLHAAQSAESERSDLEAAKQTAKKVGNRPGLMLRIDDLRMDGQVGFVNKSGSPAYRLFLDKASLHLVNLSNHFSQGPAQARLEGFFMGSGKTEISARFRSDRHGPDFDFFARILGTDLKAMNDFLRTHGDVDVAGGSFSVFMEAHVNNQRIRGYVKPFFEDLNVYEKGQDEEKSLFRKLYEGVIDGIANLLENEASEKVATKADISGPVENPEASTWQVIVNLIQNAFVKIILPGFEEGAD